MTPKRRIAISMMEAAGYALLGALLLAAQAPQQPPATAGAASSEQAARGQQLYQAQCANCHGDAMEGTAGPPLAGDEFLASWSARPLASFVDKIQKTMPFGRPESLSREQSIDLAAHILEVAKVPIGQGGLSESNLARITFPTVAASRDRTFPGQGPQPEGNLAELMRAIAFPNSNVLFNLQVKDPSNEPKKEAAAVPFDYVEWGKTVYTGWLAVDQAAVALVETAPLLLTPGRRCQNGKLAPVDREDWKQYVADLVAVSKQARQASQARNLEVFVEISEKLNDACANCHAVYRDKGGTEGSGANRCQ